MSPRNFFVATVAVLLVAGGALGASWAYYLAQPMVLGSYGGMVTTTVTVGATQTPTAPTSTSTAGVVTSTPGGGVPNVTVDFIGLVVLFANSTTAKITNWLSVTNPSGSPITVTSIKYQIWIKACPAASLQPGESYNPQLCAGVSETFVGTGGMDQATAIGPKSSANVRTDMTVDLTKLPQGVINIMLVQGTPGILHIKGDLQVKDGFGTAGVPFEGEGDITVPIAT